MLLITLPFNNERLMRENPMCRKIIAIIALASLAAPALAVSSHGTSAKHTAPVDHCFAGAC